MKPTGHVYTDQSCGLEMKTRLFTAVAVAYEQSSRCTNYLIILAQYNTPFPQQKKTIRPWKQWVQNVKGKGLTLAQFN